MLPSLFSGLYQPTMARTIISILGLFFIIGSISSASHPRVVGGVDGHIKHFPFLVSIRQFGDHFCGGSIISDRHILTAGHCFLNRLMFAVTVDSGTSRSDKQGRTVHRIKSVKIHPKIDLRDDSKDFNDIAILTLEEPIVFNKYQQKINLPSRDVHSHQVGYAIGWSKTSKSGWSVSKQLQKLRVAVLPHDKCQPMLIANINEKQVCIFRSVKSGVCYGDSGGPLVSEGAVVGIASFADRDECAVGVPDVYTNVFQYKDFIESIINEK